MDNDYYLCYPDRHVAWSPSDPPTHEWTRTAYFGDVFCALERHLPAGDLTVYLTNNHRELPSYGDNVLAVLQEDEPARTPHYADRVLATFTCYGTSQPFPPPGFGASLEGLLSMAKAARNGLLRLPGRLHYHWARLTSDAAPTVIPIPLGYANQVDVPYRPIRDRPHDVFFAGSIRHDATHRPLKQWLGSPKYYARKPLVENLRTLQEQDNRVAVDLEVKDAFETAVGASAQRYSRRMMNSKVAPVPRGTSPESFRLFEALRFGCIPVVRTLPSRWFYNGCPAIRIEDWTDLRPVVHRLLRRPSRLRQKHEAALTWWETHCSEEVVGRLMARTVRQERASHASYPSL